MKDLNICKIKDLDDIFEATKESQGTNNAILAIKYVLFDNEDVFEGKIPDSNKYLYISNENNARKKAMMFQKDDLAHILIKYCMQSFGLRGKDFTITEDDLLISLKRIEHLELGAYEIIEYIAYAATGEINNAYRLLYTNKDILNDVVDYMLNERYIREFREQLDNFSGIIDNNGMKSEERFKFYDAYCNLDDTFAELKRNNPDYVK